MATIFSCDWKSRLKSVGRCTELMSEERERRSFILPILLLFLVYTFGVPFWIVAIIGFWYLGLLYCESEGILDRINATRALGIILMIRTRRGMGILEFISKPRKFWRLYGEFSIWLCFFVMIGVVLMLILGAISAALSPPEDPLPASDLLLIPGVTSFVPFWWPVLALIVAIVIHEYSHGIQARAHGMRLRSFGLLQLGPLPIGAFAEPEEIEMDRAPKRDRLRLFAAGPSINLISTYIVLILLCSVSSGFVAENAGTHARGIIKDQPAEEAGLLPFQTITQVQGNQIESYADFDEQMELLSSGDTVTLTVLENSDGSSPVEKELLVTLGDQYQYYLDTCDGENEYEECIKEKERILDALEIEPGDAFLGVSGMVSSRAGVDGYAWIVEGEYEAEWAVVATLIRPVLMLYTPIANDGQTMILEEREMITAGGGAVATFLGTDGMLMLFDFLFWLVWINFLLGFANLIPMIPFDGGHLVRDGLHSVLKKISRKAHPMKIEVISDRISSLSSIFILLILLIPVILPRLV